MYIFYKHQGGPNNWGQLKKLTASDAENYDYFGASVSIDSGYIVVGATYEDDGGSNAGAAYIYYMNQGGTYNWGEVKIITVSDSSGSGFGNSVSLSGNYAVIGDNANDGNGTPGCLRGAVYIFNKDKGGSNNWGKVKKIIASDPADNDNFGQSVSISGDYAVVGTYSKSSNKGAVYAFYKESGGTDNWGFVKKLMASDAADGDNFSYSALSINGDDILSGAYAEDGAGTDRGAVYIFKKQYE